MKSSESRKWLLALADVECLTERRLPPPELPEPLAVVGAGV
jgi:hypothetical protein